MKKFVFWPLLAAVFCMSNLVLADASIPTKDIKGGSDSDLVGRLSGAYIIDYVSRDFDEATFPLSALKRVKGPRVGNNNIPYRPDQSKTVEGKRQRIVYLNTNKIAPLKVIRAYQRELKDLGGKELWGCKEAECGGRSDMAQGGGGNHMSLGQYLWPKDAVGGGNFSNSTCAQLGWINRQRYSLMHVPSKKAYVSIHTYVSSGGSFCNKIAGLTVSVIDIVTVGEMEAEFVTVKAEEMASEISAKGKIALYGILFDEAKADLKPESTATLKEIAGLLKSDAKLRLLIVGHTDSQGSYEYNLKLSQKRSESVVEALVQGHGIKRNRLFPVGVSFASPVATNATDAGRAKNRRVELVSF